MVLQRKSLNTLFVVLGYQLIWFMCVYGEAYQFSFFGFLFGLIYLFFFFFIDAFVHLKLVLLISFFGLVFDNCLSFLGLFQIQSDYSLFFLPYWMYVLWPVFSTLFVDVFLFFKDKFFLAVLCGAVFGPLSYFIGFSLGIVTVSNLLLALLFQSVFWGCLMGGYAKT